MPKRANSVLKPYLNGYVLMNIDLPHSNKAVGDAGLRAFFVVHDRRPVTHRSRMFHQCLWTPEWHRQQDDLHVLPCTHMQQCNSMRLLYSRLLCLTGLLSKKVIHPSKSHDCVYVRDNKSEITLQSGNRSCPKPRVSKHKKLSIHSSLFQTKVRRK